MVLIDKECREWISGTLVQEIEHRINSDFSGEEPEADQPSSKFTFAKAITGVRNKISWDNKHRTWKLYIKPYEDVTNYLAKENLTLTVPMGLTKAAFENKRTETFRTAVSVWNEIYKTAKQFKIRLPEKFEKETITIPHQEGCQRRPNDSDSEDEEESDDDIALGV